jgi:hypothetical protein
MFINLSNHTSTKWSTSQKAAASIFGEIVDIPFPAVSPHISSEELDKLVEEYFNKIQQYSDVVVMVQGEFVFTYRMIVLLKKQGIRVVAAQSERKSIEFVDDNKNTRRESVFEFIRFMEY